MGEGEGGAGGAQREGAGEGCRGAEGAGGGVGDAHLLIPLR